MQGVMVKLPRVAWRPMAFFAVFVVLNVVLLSNDVVRYFLVLPHDWHVLTELPDRLANGRLFGYGWWWVWSPLAAWLLAYVFIPLGYSFWLGLHLAMVPLLRDWRLAALTLLSVPFWVDTIIGNTVVFVFAAGALALNGSRWGALAYLALCCLMPRPLQAPLAVWLLWKRPDVRIPFVVMVAVTLIHALAGGYLADWIVELVRQSGANNEHVANFGPTRLFGSAWLLVGLPLGAWLTLKGRVGLAGLAITPYLLPMYFLVLLWEVRRWPWDEQGADRPSRPLGGWLRRASAERIGR